MLRILHNCSYQSKKLEKLKNLGSKQFKYITILKIINFRENKKISDNFFKDNQCFNIKRLKIDRQAMFF